MPKTQISKSQVRILICPEKVWACILKTLKARSHNLKLERVLRLAQENDGLAVSQLPFTTITSYSL